MILEFSDWIFNVDTQATQEYYFEELPNRCECTFCRNYFATVDMLYPGLRSFLKKFQIDLGVPEILLPFKSTLYQASYYGIGQILRFGTTPIQLDEITVVAEEGEEQNTFLLHIGLMDLPWVLEEDPSGEETPSAMRDFFTTLCGNSVDTLS